MVLVYPLESITIVCSEDVVPPLEDIYLIPPAFKEQVNLVSFVVDPCCLIWIRSYLKENQSRILLGPQEEWSQHWNWDAAEQNERCKFSLLKTVSWPKPVRTDLGHLLQESKCILFPSKDIQQLIYEWIPNSGSAALDQKPLYTKVRHLCHRLLSFIETGFSTRSL